VAPRWTTPCGLLPDSVLRLFKDLKPYPVHARIHVHHSRDYGGGLNDSCPPGDDIYQ